MTKENPQNRAGFESMLANGFVGVNLAHPGVRVLNIDPPILTIDNLLPMEVCDALVEGAKAHSALQASKIGGLGDLSGDIRTSRTLAITREVYKNSKVLAAALDALLDAAGGLLRTGQGIEGGGPALRRTLFTAPSAPGQVVAELPQVAHYAPGERSI